MGQKVPVCACCSAEEDPCDLCRVCGGCEQCCSSAYHCPYCLCPLADIGQSAPGCSHCWPTQGLKADEWEAWGDAYAIEDEEGYDVMAASERDALIRQRQAALAAAHPEA